MRWLPATALFYLHPLLCAAICSGIEQTFTLTYLANSTKLSAPLLAADIGRGMTSMVTLFLMTWRRGVANRAGVGGGGAGHGS